MTKRRHLFKDKINGNMTACLPSSLMYLAAFMKDLKNIFSLDLDMTYFFMEK